MSQATSPLLQAVEADDPAAILKAIQEGADVNTAIDDGFPPLYYAAIHGKLISAALLLTSGKARPDITRGNHHTALHVAAYRGDLRMAKILLRHGATPIYCDSEKRMPWQLAQQNGHPGLAGFLKDLAEHYQAMHATTTGSDWASLLDEYCQLLHDPC